MQDPNFSAPRPFDRPSARPNTIPVQRGNYGLPPRRPAPTPPSTPVSPVTPAPQPQPVQAVKPPTPRPATGPHMMDVVAPYRPLTPQPSAPIAPPRPVEQFPNPPSQPVVAEEPASVAPTPRQPIFTSKPAPAVIDEPAPSYHKERHLMPKVRVALLIVGAVLVLAGAGRWITAGSTSGHIIAVGAVAANNGENMTIQFTADDGMLHKLTTASNDSLIPGTSVQIAYKSGAPDNSAKQVAPIESAKRLGTAMAMTGIFLLLVSGALTVAMRRAPKHSRIALAQPVTASV